jgi:hypothetical protein
MSLLCAKLCKKTDCCLFHSVFLRLHLLNGMVVLEYGSNRMDILLNSYNIISNGK